MDILVKTDRNIEGGTALFARVRDEVEGTLDRFAGRITRVEVHLSDENGPQKGGASDMRCVMEARLKRRPPTAVTHQAPTVEQAIIGAAGKLQRLLGSTVGRLRG